MLKIRCSAIGNIMGEGKSFAYEGGNPECQHRTSKKSPNTCTRCGAERAGKVASETMYSYLQQVWRENRYDRVYEFDSKYTEKGTVQEELAITLFSLHQNRMFKKNTEKIENEFITGTPDLFIGPSIQEAKEGFDTKCSWNLWSFPFPTDPLNKNYYWQNMGYMALTGAEKWTTVFCLVNATQDLIDKEKKNLYFKMGCPNEDNENYIEGLIRIEKDMIYDYDQFKSDNPNYDLECKVWKWDIPMKERVIMFPVERDEAAIQKIYSRVQECREYVKTFNFYEEQIEVAA